MLRFQTSFTVTVMGAAVTVHTKSHAGGWVDGWVVTEFPKAMLAAHTGRFLGWACEVDQLAWVRLSEVDARTVAALQGLVDRYLLNQLTRQLAA